MLRASGYVQSEVDLNWQDKLWAFDFWFEDFLSYLPLKNMIIIYCVTDHPSKFDLEDLS